MFYALKYEYICSFSLLVSSHAKNQPLFYDLTKNKSIRSVQ